MATAKSRRRATDLAAVGVASDVSHERDPERSREQPHMSVRMLARPGAGTLRRIAVYLRRIRLFASVLDAEQAALRVYALHGDETLRWLKQVAYRETHRPQGQATGEQSANAKLDWDRVREMRALHAAGGWTHTALAKRFNVSQPTVGQILSGTTWREKTYRPAPSVWAAFPDVTEYQDEGLERLWSDLLARLPTGEPCHVADLIDLMAVEWLQLRGRAVAMVKAPQPDDFDIFWTAYPRKVGKFKARDAWGKHKPPIDKVLDALGWQVLQPQWLKDDGEYIPYPATWLNQGRWEDEPFTPVAVAPRNAGRETAAAYSIRAGQEALDAMNGGRTGNDTREQASPRERLDAPRTGDTGEGRTGSLRRVR